MTQFGTPRASQPGSLDYYSHRLDQSMLYEAPRKDPMFEDRSRGRIMDASNRATRFLFHASATLFDLKSDIFTYILYQGSPLFCFSGLLQLPRARHARSLQRKKKTPRSERSVLPLTPHLSPPFLFSYLVAAQLRGARPHSYDHSSAPFGNTNL